MNLEEVQKTIDAGDTAGCVGLFAEATEADRKAVAAYVIERLTKESKHSFSMSSEGTYRSNPLLAVAALAALAACSLSQLKKAGRHTMQGNGPEVYSIMAARRPAWIDQWAEMLLESNAFFWPLIRRLVRDGICHPPHSINYVLGTIYGFGDYNPFRNDARSITLAEALLDDRELLEEEVWKLFSVDGNGSFSLAAHDKYCAEVWCWNHTLVKLSQDGRLSRSRLLDSALDALLRDFGSFRSTWFSKFHDMLQPSVAERVERTDQYLTLLASSVPGTAAWALKAVDLLDKKHPLPAARVVDRLSPALAARPKSTVITALKLLERIAKRESDARPQIALAASQALANEASQVQELAITLIEKHGDASDLEFSESVLSYRDALAPSVRPRLEQWNHPSVSRELPKATTEVPIPNSTDYQCRIALLDPRLARLAGVPQARTALERGILEIRAIEFDGTEIPRLDRAKAIQPVATLGELIDLSATVIEGNGGIDDIERVLDGISRLCDERPEDFTDQTNWLMKRVLKLSQKGIAPFAGENLESDVLATLWAWLTNELHAPAMELRLPGGTQCDYKVGAKSVRFWHGKAREILGFFSRRSYEISARAVATRAQPLLSAPTHSGGWIDPRVLVERVKQVNQIDRDPAIIDKVLALLRLAPDGRTEALGRAKSLPGEFGDAVRHALGADRIEIGPTAELWAAAARSRSPWTDDPEVERRHPQLGPDAGRPASYQFVVNIEKAWDPLAITCEPNAPPRLSPDVVTVQLHAQLNELAKVDGITPVSIPWRHSIWPAACEAFFSAGATAIAANLDWWEARWTTRCYLEPLLDSDVPLRCMAQLLLALGLAAKEPGEQGLATEALIAAIRDGRMDGPMLGEMMGKLWPTGLIKTARWAEVLADVARVSPLHIQIVLDALESALQGDAEKLPRDVHALLELYKELAIEAGTSVKAEATRSLLKQLKGKGKTGKAAGQLLACEENPRGERIAAVMQMVLDQGLYRAERWTNQTWH